MTAKVTMGPPLYSLQSYMLTYIVLSDYACIAMWALVTWNMGNKNATQYIYAFYKQLINCKDMIKVEVKFILETNMSD